MNTRLIGVTGGIGSGKSMVCRICSLRGVPVYDCDSRAKLLMQTDPGLREFMLREIGDDAYGPDGTLDRVKVGERIFGDMSVRARVEANVHEAVRDDLTRWYGDIRGHLPVAIVESAILHTSALDCLTDRIWLVEAPDRLRVRRVMARSSLSEAEVRARMEAQRNEFVSLPAGKVSHISNDGVTPLMPRIDELLRAIYSETNN